jgi:hypothetical protein
MQQLNFTLLTANFEVLCELSDLLDQIQPHDYAHVSPVLQISSIGQHCRHIIEFYTCLIDQYEEGEISYDKRTRDLTLDTDKHFALQKLAFIKNQIIKPDKELLLSHRFAGKTINVKTSYFREILYNLEHCIHHQAMLKLACVELGYIQLSESFGIARSTLDFKKQN